MGDAASEPTNRFETLGATELLLGQAAFGNVLDHADRSDRRPALIAFDLGPLVDPTNLTVGSNDPVVEDKRTSVPLGRVDPIRDHRPILGVDDQAPRFTAAIERRRVCAEDTMGVTCRASWVLFKRGGTTPARGCEPVSPVERRAPSELQRSSHMNCAVFRSLVLDYFHALVEGQQLVDFDTHRAMCDMGCGTYFEEIRQRFKTGMACVDFVELVTTYSTMPLIRPNAPASTTISRSATDARVSWPRCVGRSS